MKIYDNNRGFQLGNLLYLLLQAYKDQVAGEEAYVLRTGYYKLAQTIFPKSTRLFSKANGSILEDFGYFQISGEHFTSNELDNFCKDYLLQSTYEQSKDFQNKDVCIAIRRTDFLKGNNYKNYGYDNIKYIIDCFNQISKKESYKTLTVRITSDDVKWCEDNLVPMLKEKFDVIENIVVEKQDIRDNFLQLYSCDKYFICPNSTYCYWVGYLLRLGKPYVEVFVPNFNTTLIKNGEQIADVRNWTIVEVDRTNFK